MEREEERQAGRHIKERKHVFLTRTLTHTNIFISSVHYNCTPMNLLNSSGFIRLDNDLSKAY
jgi:hypothetical protein